MKSIIFLAFSSLMLNGCVAVEQHANIREFRDEQIADAEGLALAGKRLCVDQRHAGIITSLADSGRCSKAPIIAAYERVKFPYMDLVEQYTDKRIEILDELDNGLIPEERSYKKMYECLHYLKAEAHVRDLEAEKL